MERLWYALQKNENDGWSYGSENIKEAQKMLMANPNYKYISIIKEDINTKKMVDTGDRLTREQVRKYYFNEEKYDIPKKEENSYKINLDKDIEFRPKNIENNYKINLDKDIKVNNGKVWGFVKRKWWLILILIIIFNANGRSSDSNDANTEVQQNTRYEQTNDDDITEKEKELEEKEKQLEIKEKQLTRKEKQLATKEKQLKKKKKTKVANSSISSGSTSLLVSKVVRNKKSYSSTKKKTTNARSCVYITRTGKKYHKAWCGSLWKSKIAISLHDAQSRGYTACKKCY